MTDHDKLVRACLQILKMRGYPIRVLGDTHSFVLRQSRLYAAPKHPNVTNLFCAMPPSGRLLLIQVSLLPNSEIKQVTAQAGIRKDVNAGGGLFLPVRKLDDLLEGLSRA